MELMTVQETAKYLKVDTETVRRWLREGKIPGSKVGRKWLISKLDIDAMLKKDK